MSSTNPLCETKRWSRFHLSLSLFLFDLRACVRACVRVCVFSAWRKGFCVGHSYRVILRAPVGWRHCSSCLGPVGSLRPRDVTWRHHGGRGLMSLCRFYHRLRVLICAANICFGNSGVSYSAAPTSRYSRPPSLCLHTPSTPLSSSSADVTTSSPFIVSDVPDDHRLGPATVSLNLDSGFHDGGRSCWTTSARHHLFATGARSRVTCLVLRRRAIFFVFLAHRRQTRWHVLVFVRPPPSAFPLSGVSGVLGVCLGVQSRLGAVLILLHSYTGQDMTGRRLFLFLAWQVSAAGKQMKKEKWKQDTKTNKTTTRRKLTWTSTKNSTCGTRKAGSGWGGGGGGGGGGKEGKKITKINLGGCSASEFIFAWHSTSWRCTTIPSWTTKDWVAQRVSSDKARTHGDKTLTQRVRYNILTPLPSPTSTTTNYCYGGGEWVCVCTMTSSCEEMKPSHKYQISSSTLRLRGPHGLITHRHPKSGNRSARYPSTRSDDDHRALKVKKRKKSPQSLFFPLLLRTKKWVVRTGSDSHCRPSTKLGPGHEVSYAVNNKRGQEQRRPERNKTGEERETERGRQTDRQTDRDREGQTAEISKERERQTERQTDRERQRQRSARGERQRQRESSKGGGGVGKNVGGRQKG